MSLAEQYLVTKYLNSNGATICPPMPAKGIKQKPRSRKRRAFLES